MFCQQNVEQHLKAKRVTSLQDKQRAAKILAKNKQQTEREHPPSDQLAFERFRFFHADQFKQNAKSDPKSNEQDRVQNTFGLLPDQRKQELRNLCHEGRLRLSQLTPTEQTLFLGFAERQSRLRLWVPIWGLDQFVPDLDVLGNYSRDLPNAVR